MSENNMMPELAAVETAEDYKTQSEINDMRQHANKIIQGIKKLNQHDANRAIWELFQNAVDLSQNSQIEIHLNEDSMEFCHNGIPFTPMTLDCLFKQVSSKTLEEKKEIYEDGDPVGQYGTGFMTSHVFGKELVINGAIAKGKGYIPLENFVIDRRTDNWKVLANSIRNLKLQVTDLLERNYDPLPLPYPKTRFMYKFASEQNKLAAQKAIASLSLILPYVMALNPNLKTVEVYNLNGNTTVYNKKESYPIGELNVRPIEINGNVQEICYIETLDKKTTIILPMNKDLNAVAFDEKLPRLFLYYPLIGTEDFGCNFIFHSRQFQPTEPRNALHLKSDNESNTKDETQNQLLLTNASSRIFDFLKDQTGGISQRIHLATINFKVNDEDEFLNSYFKELKSSWINTFKDLPIVETASGLLTPLAANFLDNEILSAENGFESSFPLAQLFYPTMPSKELTEDWTQKVNEWGLGDIVYICAEDIVKKIQAEAMIAKFENVDNLKRFYLFLISNDKIHFFSQYRILPNIFGDFRYIAGNEGLNNPLNITQELIEIAKVIMPEVPKRHIEDNFRLGLELSDYNRKNYGVEILTAITEKIDDNTLGEGLDEEFLSKLIDYCKLSNSSGSSSVPTEMVKLISRFYNKSQEIIMINQVEDDKLDIRPVQKRLVRLMLNDLKKRDSNWVADNIDFLKELLALSGYDAYEEMFSALDVFPNQLNELRLQTFLAVDAPIPEEIKDLYDVVIKSNRPIRAGLVHNDFADFLKVKQKRAIRDITEKIEGVFFGESDLINLNDHPFRAEILRIVDTFKTNAEYARHYPLIFSQRSSILVNLADGEDSFTILSMPPKKISELAKLGSDPNFDQIVALGRAALLSQQQENANFEHKYMLGTHIEAILRKGLTGILADEVKADVKDVQNGQDIIISIGESPVYYIEVKSRWDSNNPIRMSKNQTRRAFEKKENYALCSVDLTLYKGSDALEVQEISEIADCMYFAKDIGKKVEHLIAILDQENDPDLINLEGDYRTRIPMSYVKTGENLEVFETFLLDYIQKKISNNI